MKTDMTPKRLAALKAKVGAALECEQRIAQLEKERNDPLMLGTLYFGEGFGRFAEPIGSSDE